MGFIQKEWSNPISVNATELNRIEKGVKNSHDSIEILGGEILNLQLKQRQTEINIQNLTNNSNILETLTNLQTIVNNNSSLIETLQNTSNLVTQAQLSSSLNAFLRLTDIKQDGHSIVNGSEVNINSTIVDNFLNKASTNAISNKAVAQALENIASKLVIPTKLSDLNQDSTHLLVTQEEKNLWNAGGNQQSLSEETDPTVPEWAKQPTKPEYEWTEILYKPTIKNFISEFPDVTNYSLSTHNHDGVYSLLSHNHDTSYASLSHNHDTDYASISHNHNSDYAPLSHNHDTDYAAISHTHTEFSSIVDSTGIQSMIDTSIAALINGAPTTLDTLKELADAISNNADLISALNSAVANHTHNNYVTLNTTQTITSQKTFNSSTYFSGSIYRTSTINPLTTPSSTQYNVIYWGLGNNSVALGVSHFAHTSGGDIQHQVDARRIVSVLKAGCTIKSGSTVQGTTYSSDTVTTSDINITSNATLKAGSIIVAGSYIRGTLLASGGTVTSNNNKTITEGTATANDVTLYGTTYAALIAGITKDGTGYTSSSHEFRTPSLKVTGNITNGTLTTNLNDLVNKLKSFRTGTDSSLSSYWFPLWKQTELVGTNSDLFYSLLIGNKYSNPYLGSGILEFGIRQNNDNTGNDTNAYLKVMSGNLNPQKFKMIKRTSDNMYELWVNTNSRWQNCVGEMLKCTDRNTVYYTPQKGTFTTSLFSTAQTQPAGTETACSCDLPVYIEDTTGSADPSPFADYYNKSTTDTLLGAKANNTASNLSDANVESWRSKLGIKDLPIGSIIHSSIPLNDASLKLADGSLISQNGIYSAFYNYIVALYNSGNASSCFVNETTYQTNITLYGSCGKYVYDSTNHTIRIPTLKGILEGTLLSSNLGVVKEAGLPNITGNLFLGWNDSSGGGVIMNSTNNATSAVYHSRRSGKAFYTSGSSHSADGDLEFDASRSNSIYGNSSTVQPQTVQVYYYIVVASSVKTEVEVDIDNIATNLNNKADLNASNLSSANTLSWQNKLKQSQLVVDYTLSSDSSSFTISNLDGAADGGIYDIIVEGYIATQYDLRLKINNISTGYFGSLLRTNGTSSATGNISSQSYCFINYANFFLGDMITSAEGVFNITLVQNGKNSVQMTDNFSAIASGAVNGGYAGGQLYANSGLTNITSLTFSSGANLKKGMRVRIFKRANNTATRS